MPDTGALRARWEAVRSDRAPSPFASARLEPASFLMVHEETGGDGVCATCVTSVGVFDDARDALAFLRHAEIVRALHADTGASMQGSRAEAYLERYDDGVASQFESLLSMLDRAIASPVVSKAQLEEIRLHFNSDFDVTRPQLSILAWGDVDDVLLRSAHCREAIACAAAEGDEAFATLSDLVLQGAFDPDEPEHLSLARRLLKERLAIV